MLEFQTDSKSGLYQKIQRGKSYAELASLGNTESLGGVIWKRKLIQTREIRRKLSEKYLKSRDEELKELKEKFGHFKKEIVDISLFTFITANLLNNVSLYLFSI